MRVTDVQAFLLSSPMPQPIRMEFYGGVRTITKRDAAFVRIATDGGLTGYGPAAASEQAVAAINGPIRDAVLGADPAEVEALRARGVPAESVLAGSPALAAAFGAVEIALYDLWGKREGVPVHALLGGKVRERLRLYGSAGMYQSPQGYAAEAVAVAALGFSAYKMRPALGPEGDLDTVRLMREAVGPDVGLMVDAHAWWRMGDRSYSPETIEQLARGMAAYGITWLEEPLPPEDRDAYVRLREAGIVSVAAGEHEHSLEGFMELIRRGAVDVAQADPVHQGGYGAVRQVLQACADHGREFAFHNWGTLLECLAMAHLGVCFPAEVCAWLEYPCYRHRGQPIMYPYPLADDLLKAPLPVERGELVIPDAPGLGIDVDESVIERYPYLPGPWSVVQVASPPGEFFFSGDHSLVWDAG